MKELRFIVAGCEVRSYANAFTTTVIINVDVPATPMDISQIIREQAAKQIDKLYAFDADPLMVVVLNTEDTTFALDPE